MRRPTIKLSYEGSINKQLTYYIVLVSLFLTFFSFFNLSMGMECILFALIILLLNFKRSHLKLLLPFVAICFFTIILYFLSGQTEVRGFNAPVNHVLKFVYLMFTVALSIGISELSQRARSNIMRWVLISVLISAVVSIYSVIFIDKYAVRYSADLGFDSVVDFGQFYGICFILSSLTFIVLSYRKQLSVWKLALTLVPLIVVIAISLFVTGVLLSALGIVIGFALYLYNSSKTKAAIWTVLFVLLLIIMLLFNNQISDWVYNVTEPFNWILRDRIRRIADTFFSTDHNLIYTYDRREELAGYSLSTFKKHPIFGIGYKQYGYGIIGCHQEWQDMLGVFGLVGSTIVFSSIIYLIKDIKDKIDNQVDLHSFFISVILFVVLGFLNPCMNLPVLTAVFVVSPNISLLLPWWNETNRAML